MKGLSFGFLGAAAWVLTACSTDTFTGADADVDGGVTQDAASSDGSRSDAGCTPTPIVCPANALCSSFDDSQDNTFNPFANISLNGGSVTYETDKVVSCPRGILASSSSNATQPRGAIGASAKVTQVASAHARIETDVFLPDNVEGDVVFVALGANADSTTAVSFAWSSGNWVVVDGVTGDVANVQPRVGDWNHVALDVTFSSAATNLGKIELDYEDTNGHVQKASMQKATLPTGSATVSSVAFSLGVMPTGTAAGTTNAYYDNVQFSPF